MQPRKPSAFFLAMAHCWLMVKLVSTGTPRSFSASLLSSWVASSKNWNLGLFLLRWRTSHFSLLNSMRFLPDHFSTLSGTCYKKIYLLLLERLINSQKYHHVKRILVSLYSKRQLHIKLNMEFPSRVIEYILWQLYEQHIKL